MELGLSGSYRYRAEVLEALLAHGMRPASGTPPARVKEWLNDLYRYELRRLRDRLLEGEFPRREYAARVVELRRKYPLLSLPVRLWTVRLD